MGLEENLQDLQRSNFQQTQDINDIMEEQNARQVLHKLQSMVRTFLDESNGRSQSHFNVYINETILNKLFSKT